MSMDAPLKRWLSFCRKSLMAIAQAGNELYSTNPGSNIPHSSSCTAIYRPSRRPSKLDEQDMRETAGEVKKNI